MSLKDSIAGELIAAMKVKDELRVSVFRMLLAATKNKTIERYGASGEELSDDEVMKVVQGEMKKRRDAQKAYRDAGRDESATREAKEAEVLAVLLPAELSDDEVRAIMEEGVRTLGLSGAAEFGTLMKWVMPRLGGRAGGERVSKMIRERLSQK